MFNSYENNKDNFDKIYSDRAILCLTTGLQRA